MNTAQPGVVFRSKARSSAPRYSSSSATGASTPTARKIKGMPTPVDRAGNSHGLLAGDRSVHLLEQHERRQPRQLQADAGEEPAHVVAPRLAPLDGPEPEIRLE